MKLFACVFCLDVLLGPNKENKRSRGELLGTYLLLFAHF